MDEVLSHLPPLRMMGMLVSRLPETYPSPLRCNWNFPALQSVGRAVGQQEQHIPWVFLGHCPWEALDEPRSRIPSPAQRAANPLVLGAPRQVSDLVT